MELSAGIAQPRRFRRRRRQDRVATCDSVGYRARWLDYHAGITKELTVGTAPFEELKDKFESEEKARAAATAKLNKGKRGEKTLSLTLPGDPGMAAEYRLRVLLRPEVSTDTESGVPTGASPRRSTRWPDAATSPRSKQNNSSTLPAC